MALAVGGVDPPILMLTYAFAVMAALIGVSAFSVIAYSLFRADRRSMNT